MKAALKERIETLIILTIAISTGLVMLLLNLVAYHPVGIASSVKLKRAELATVPSPLLTATVKNDGTDTVYLLYTEVNGERQTLNLSLAPGKEITLKIPMGVERIEVRKHVNLTIWYMGKWDKERKFVSITLLPPSHSPTTS